MSNFRGEWHLAMYCGIYFERTTDCTQGVLQEISVFQFAIITRKRGINFTIAKHLPIHVCSTRMYNRIHTQNFLLLRSH